MSRSLPGMAGAATTASTAARPVVIAPRHRDTFGVPHATRLAPSRQIVARSLPKANVGRAPLAHAQPPDPAELARRRGYAISPAPGKPRLVGDIAAKAARPGATNGFFENQVSFTGATLNNTGCCEPPDTQVAVGLNQVFEEVNLGAFSFDRGGTQLGSFSLVCLNDCAANANASNPKVLFDPNSGRYFATLMMCFDGACGGANWTKMGVYLAVSTSDDPLGGWTIYPNLFNFDKGNFQDQPKLGFSSDKVTVSANVYRGHSTCACDFLHEDLVVLQKSDLVSGVLAGAVSNTSAFVFDTVPVTPVTLTTTQYVVWNAFGSIGVAQITGTPNAGTVDMTNVQTPAIANMTALVSAPGIPDVGNTYFESAVFQNNDLWATATDGCIPGGDNVVRDCIRLVEVNVSNPAVVSVVTDTDLGGNATYRVFPSVMKDAHSNLLVGFTYSDFSTFPSAATDATALPCCSFTRVNTAFGNVGYSGSRWGDYSGMAQDPVDTGNVWSAQEFGGLDASGNWATNIAAFTFDLPTITSVSPASGPSDGGTLVDIMGFNFANGVNSGTSVSFGGIGTFVLFLTPQHVQAFSPTSVPGLVDVTATTLNGTSATSSSDLFAYLPTVVGVTPNKGPIAGGTSVDVTGSGFLGASNVSFGGVGATFVVNNDTDITAVAPAEAAGTVDVIVTTSGQSSPTSTADNYTYFNGPSLGSMSPTSGSTAGGQTVFIFGSNLTGSTSVSFGGTAAGFTVLNDTRIIATTPAHAAGLVNVIVAGPGGTSNALTYTYAPTPTLTSISPSSGSIGGGQSVTIRGTNLTGTSSVSFATTPATFTVVNNILITATTPVHVAGAVGVTAVTLGGKSNAVTYTYVVPPLPVVTSVSPTSGPTAGGTTVTIKGSNFSQASVVRFGTGNASSYTVDNDTRITAITKGHPPALVDVTVTTPGGTSAIAAADHYTFNSPPLPAITAVSPTNGPVAGGTTVTIIGSHFTGAFAVKFGTTAVTTFTLVADNKITATSPAHAASTVDVRVTTAAGVSAIVAADHYTFNPPPVPAITSVTPNTGPTAGGQTVTIVGSHFTGATDVRFGTTLATGVTVVSDTRITATTPAHGSTTTDVRVTSPAGTSAIVAADHFTFVSPPAVASVSPGSGTRLGGQTVTITGTNFTAATSVKFGTTAATAFTVVNSTKITATTPAHGAVTVDVRVTTRGGTSVVVARDSYIYT